jgi:uncharacterized protein YaaN involved in tellurite resistance
MGTGADQITSIELVLAVVQDVHSLLSYGVLWRAELSSHSEYLLANVNIKISVDNNIGSNLFRLMESTVQTNVSSEL